MRDTNKLETGFIEHLSKCVNRNNHIPTIKIFIRYILRELKLFNIDYDVIKTKSVISEKFIISLFYEDTDLFGFSHKRLVTRFIIDCNEPIEQYIDFMVNNITDIVGTLFE